MAYHPYHFVGEVLLHPVYIILSIVPGDCLNDGTYLPSTLYSCNMNCIQREKTPH